MFRLFLINCFTTLILISFSSVSFPVGLEELAAYWSFDKGSGDKVSDDSGNGKDGTLKGPEWQKGRFSSALEFDGVDDYVDLAETSATLFDDITVTIDIPNKVGKFYLNGEMKDEFKLPISGTKMSSNPDGGNSKISIGAIRYTSAHCWRGIIDELRIWSEVLDAGEVKKKMGMDKRQLMAIVQGGKLATNWGKLKAQ